jgi:hypothetical protein
MVASGFVAVRFDLVWIAVAPWPKPAKWSVASGFVAVRSGSAWLWTLETLWPTPARKGELFLPRPHLSERFDFYFRRRLLQY